MDTDFAAAVVSQNQQTCLNEELLHGSNIFFVVFVFKVI